MTYVVEHTEYNHRDGEYVQTEECATAAELSAWWDDFVGCGSAEAASEEVAELVSGEVVELRHTHPETGAETTARRG